MVFWTIVACNWTFSYNISVEYYRLSFCTFHLLKLRLTPSTLHSDLVDDWFPGNATVQSLFFSSDVRSFLNSFNQSLPDEHMRVLSVGMISAQVMAANNLIKRVVDNLFSRLEPKPLCNSGLPPLGQTSTLAPPPLALILTSNNL